MKRLVLVLALLLTPALVLAQPRASGTLTSDICPGTGCLSLSVTGNGSVGIQITGTWTGTITFEGSVDGLTFQAITMFPTNSITGASTTTSNGVWSASVGGLTIFRARMSTYGTGSAVLSMGLAASSRGVAGGGGGGGGAPADATYVTQTPNATLSAEQALSLLSSGIMRVATTTGAVTSLTNSAGILANVSDATGTGALVFGTAPTITLTNGTGLPLTTGVTGDLPLSSLAQASAASRLLGRGSAGGAGDYQEITLGAGVSMSTTTLTGKIAQIVPCPTTAEANGTTTVPADDTIPQNTEGTEFMTCSITPTDAASTLIVSVNFFGASGTTSRYLTVALFQDSTADALNAVSSIVSTTNGTMTIPILHTMTAGTTSSTTFKVRAGVNTSGTTVFNGATAGNRLYGAIPKSTILITEILP